MGEKSEIVSRIYLSLYSSNQAEYIDSSTDIQSVKWIDVTEIIKESKNGYYIVEKIPMASLNKLENHNQRIGWSLSVVYENNNMPNRNISINIGIERQNFAIPRENRVLEIDGFKVPKIPRSSYLTIVSSNGSPNFYSSLNIYNDKLLINNITSEHSVGNFIECRFSNPNNIPIVPHDNIFSGIIMDTNTESLNYGNLNTKGTLGNKNNNPFNALNQSSYKGNRAKLDILSFDISEKMLPNQEKLFMITEIWNPNKDVFVDIILYAIQIDTDEEVNLKSIESNFNYDNSLISNCRLNENLNQRKEKDTKIDRDLKKQYILTDEVFKNLDYFSNLNNNQNDLKNKLETIHDKLEIMENAIEEDIEDEFQDFYYKHIQDDFHYKANFNYGKNQFTETQNTADKNLTKNTNEVYKTKNETNIEKFEDLNIYCVDESNDVTKENFFKNFVTTNNISVTKISDKNIYQINDIITFTIKISNNSLLDLKNVVLIDSIPINSSLEVNSLIVDGITINGNELPIHGISIGKILASSTINVIYRVKFYSMPFKLPIQVNPKITFIFPINGIPTLQSLIGISNNIEVINDPITIIKLYANRTDAISGDIITYSLIIENNGSKIATNVRILDNIPFGLSFIENSLIVNGTSIKGNLNTGIIIPDIPANSTSLVTFNVTVT